MLNHDLVAIDCKSSGYPCFKNPYAMDLNDSPVTWHDTFSRVTGSHGAP